MSKILVAYYSRSGFTRSAAKQIASACGADLEHIKEVEWRTGCIGYIRSAMEGAMHSDAAIRRGKHAPGNYDLVVIGTPVWFWNVSSPVRTYLNRHRRGIKRAAFFCTCGGSGQTKVLRDMAAIVDCPAVATLALTDDEIRGGIARKRIAEFAAGLRAASESPAIAAATDHGFNKSGTGLLDPIP